MDASREPQEAVAAWGGQMIDAAFGDTFLFNGRMRPEAVLGVGVQKRIMRCLLYTSPSPRD